MFKNFLSNLLLKLKVFGLAIVLFTIISMLLFVMVLFVFGTLPFARVEQVRKHNEVYYELYMRGTRVAYLPTFSTFVSKVEEP
jgi:hypothetical protein